MSEEEQRREAKQARREARQARREAKEHRREARWEDYLTEFCELVRRAPLTKNIVQYVKWHEKCTDEFHRWSAVEWKHKRAFAEVEADDDAYDKHVVAFKERRASEEKFFKARDHLWTLEEKISAEHGLKRPRIPGRSDSFFHSWLMPPSRSVRVVRTCE